MTPAYIANTGVICAIGIGSAQCSASFRAGLSGYVQSSVVARCKEQEQLVLALVPDDDLEPLHAELEHESLTSRERRMLRLAGPALQQACGEAHEPCPLFLALPRSTQPDRSHTERGFMQHLSLQAARKFDLAGSQCFELGRASGIFALQAGMAALASGRSTVLVGGVDTCLDLQWLARMDRDRRLLGADVKDGFVPGEAAAFIQLTRKPNGVTAVIALGTAQDAGHRHSMAPGLGEGLAAALNDARSQHPNLSPVRSCFAGLNGEQFGAKEWGVARMRHHDLFDPALRFEHPADCFGDVGAAMATLLLALADETVRAGHHPAPVLIWASSDDAPCGCAYLSATR